MLLVFLVLLAQLSAGSALTDDEELDFRSKEVNDEVTWLTRRWAPLVWLAPGERFMPDSVPHFLRSVVPMDPLANVRSQRGLLPTGPESQHWFLMHDTPMEKLLENNSSFIYGKNPQLNRVPVYAVIHRCASPPLERRRRQGTNSINSVETAPSDKRQETQLFHVTYWFFYPYSEGKDICFLGPVPIPQVLGRCLGTKRTYGNHLGDWEHVTLLFSGRDTSGEGGVTLAPITPERMYVSAHDAGAYYRYDKLTNVFMFESQETRKGILQKPVFPKLVHLKGSHPVLFSARGSHGMWSMPGAHRYVRVPRLLDETGFGTAWETWKELHIIDFPYRRPSWLHYRGSWGTPRANCNALLDRIGLGGLNLCQLSEGPPGIPLKKPHFKCQSISSVAQSHTQ